MEIGLREILITVGAIIIALILLDGFRRARDSKRNSISLKIDSSLSGEDLDDYGGELPSGGSARVLRDQDDILGLSAQRDEDDINFESMSTQNESVGQQQQMFAEDVDDSVAQSRAVAGDDSGEDITDVVVINVVASNEPLQGQRLLKYLVSAGLRYGEMKIFHRHVQASGQGPIIFSMANMVKPGIFELEKMDEFTTPGLSFFLSLPGPKDSVGAFDTMVSTCEKLAHQLDCELRDENQSALTQQTIQHYRQRVQEFERRSAQRADAELVH